MASGSRLHPHLRWITAGIGLAGAARVPSAVERRDRVPRHGPGVAADPLRWDLRLNWESWERVWEQGSPPAAGFVLRRQHPAQPNAS